MKAAVVERTGDTPRYRDWPEPERKRDLLRLWLVARRPLDLPADFARGGITSRTAAFGASS